MTSDIPPSKLLGSARQFRKYPHQPKRDTATPKDTSKWHGRILVSLGQTETTSVALELSAPRLASLSWARPLTCHSRQIKMASGTIVPAAPSRDSIVCVTSRAICERAPTQEGILHPLIAWNQVDCVCSGHTENITRSRPRFYSLD